MQLDTGGVERVVCYPSRQLQAAERNYLVHDKKFLSIKYDLAKFRVYLLGDRPFIFYTDHASLRTAVHSPHLSQRMARWLSFFAEYNFSMEYKPGGLNVVADALSRQTDFEPAAQSDTVAVLTSSIPSSTLFDDIRQAYDLEMLRLMDHLSHPSPQSMRGFSPVYLSSIDRYTVNNGLLKYSAVDGDTPRVVVTEHVDLQLRIMHEYHDAQSGGHRGREKSISLLVACKGCPFHA